MADPPDHLQTVGALADDLSALGLTPVLVGGMALVVHRRGDAREPRHEDEDPSHLFAIASDEDLLALKRIAAAARLRTA